MPSLPGSYNVNEDKNVEHAFFHTSLYRQRDLPIQRTYPFGPERPLSTGAPNENPRGTSSLSHSLGEGPSRPRAVRSQLSIPSLTPPAEFGSGDEKHKSRHPSLGSGISAQDDSGSRLAALVSSTVARPWYASVDGLRQGVQYPRGRKRKRSSDEDGDMTRNAPRPRRGASSRASAPTQVGSSANRFECQVFSRPSRDHLPQSFVGSKSSNHLMCVGIPSTTGFSKVPFILLSTVSLGSGWRMPLTSDSRD